MNVRIPVVASILAMLAGVASAGTPSLGGYQGFDQSRQTALRCYRGQIVGQSCDADFTRCRAVSWQDGLITDLTASVAARPG